MKVIVALAVIVQTFIVLVSGAKINYDGLVLTSIDVKPVEGTNKVRFSSSIKGRADDDDAVFLKNIVQINDKDEDGKRLFEADRVSVTEAKKIINDAATDGKGKPLFCIHGFNVQVGGHLKNCKNVSAELFNKGKFMVVPVIWPSAGGITNYGNDRVTGSVGAGEGLKSLKKGMDNFPAKSLLAHSMGNRVLRHAADAKFKFDNIFMAAADVPHSIFNRDYIRSTNDENSEKRDGLNIVKMLSRDSQNKPKGKVYVLTNSVDYALTGSNWRNWKPRLGAVGAGHMRNWRGAFRFDPKNFDDEIPAGCIENKNCNPLLGWSQKLSHSYQFFPFAVKFYQEKHF